MRGKTARELTAAEIRDIAIRYLARREYGVAELAHKLVQRGADSGVVNEVVAELAESDLVSDIRFAEMYVRTRMQRLFGPLKIRAELHHRGVAGDAIESCLPTDTGTWNELATQWARKKHRGGSPDYAARVKVYRSLANRGFNHEQASAAVSRLQRDAPD